MLHLLLKNLHYLMINEATVQHQVVHYLYHLKVELLVCRHLDLRDCGGYRFITGRRLYCRYLNWLSNAGRLND